MSSLSRLQKNAETYRINQFYNNMTPEQYREGIKVAVKNATDSLKKEYNRNLEKIEENAVEQIKTTVRLAIDTISVELLYELGRQLGCFEENAEYLEEKKEKVQDIYQNTMKAIDKYTNYKKNGQARRNFEKRKNTVEKMFNIKF